MGAHPVSRCAHERVQEGLLGAALLAEIPLTDFNNSNRIKTITETLLQKDPSIDAVFSIGSCCIAAMNQVRADLGDRGKAMQWGTIDVTTGAMQSLKAHELDFALTRSNTRRATIPWSCWRSTCGRRSSPASPTFVTGPAVVTPDNVAKVAAPRDAEATLLSEAPVSAGHVNSRQRKRSRFASLRALLTRPECTAIAGHDRGLRLLRDLHGPSRLSLSLR